MGKPSPRRKAQPPVSGEVSLDLAVRLTGVRPDDLIEFAASACEAAAATTRRKRSQEGRVDILVAGDAHLRALNRDFRGKDHTTDVLSFPAGDAGDYSLAGDIAISAAVARANARRFGHSLADELKILILHGMLHLAGHDHERDGGQMSRLESQLRRELNLPLALIARTSRRNGRTRRVP